MTAAGLTVNGFSRGFIKRSSPSCAVPVVSSGWKFCSFGHGAFFLELFLAPQIAMRFPCTG
jgi:hypothetical protein